MYNKREKGRLSNDNDFEIGLINCWWLVYKLVKKKNLIKKTYNIYYKSFLRPMRPRPRPVFIACFPVNGEASNLELSCIVVYFVKFDSRECERGGK